MPSKVHAYVWDKREKKYLTDENDRELKVHIEDALKLKKQYPHLHERRKYMHLHRFSERREPLKLVENGNGTQFYAFIGTPSSHNIEGYDESESHSAAIDALSKLVNMTFRIGDYYLPEFNFIEVIAEPIIKLPNGNVYSPDILCLFDESHPLYDKWGGKLAIEVTYSHPCDRAKLHDFEFHCIPILEVVIEDDTWKQYPGERNKWQYFSKESIENHINKLTDSFSRYIDVNLLVDPISTRSHQKIVNELNLSISTQSSEIQSLKTEIIRLSRIADEKEKVLSETTENLRVLKNNTSSLQRLLHDERKRVSVLDDEKLKLTNENNGLMIGGKRLINELSSKKFQLVCVCSLLALVFISIFLVPWLFPNEYKLIVNWLWHLYH
ncbi:hypothetical protein [Vibrio cholerae]|uniref:hypothetical protein n=1 Tax=Vibrio cholerae TaxID=666 RepID=UPI000F0B5676|nr:hypothetical protein [Vibrio cholerae]RNE61491.1 hypothetical protein EEJ33_11065 [Vibrio cholerae]GHY82626.1 hypothetical protein VCSRO75_0438 [Vibrio cholerae]